MALPHFKDYYYAAQIKPLINTGIPSFHGSWKDTELNIMNVPPVHAVLAHKNLERFIKLGGEYKLDNKFQIIQ